MKYRLVVEARMLAHYLEHLYNKKGTPVFRVYHAAEQRLARRTAKFLAANPPVETIVMPRVFPVFDNDEWGW